MAISEHKDYAANKDNWEKWRLVYAGGEDFKEEYLYRFSAREKDTDFETRRNITYNPAFAKANIKEVNNAIFQRMVDVSRVGGSDSYQFAVEGLNGGVDQRGSSMMRFIGNEILPDLLVIGKVGVFVDNTEYQNELLSDSVSVYPYLYRVKAENIVDWKYDYYRGSGFFTMVLIKDSDDQNNTFYRQFIMEDGTVTFYQLDGDGNPMHTVRTSLTKIPFTVAELSSSLMADIADYQIGLLNLASSDMSFAWKANFPLYTQQRNSRERAGQQDKTPETITGVTHGKIYDLNTERPAFIHPSSEPLVASMQKQDQMIRQMRQMIGLSISNIEGASSNVSAEAMNMSDRSLEAGLSAIGLELQHLENQINSIWAEYVGGEPAITKYPDDYSLKNDQQRQSETESLSKLMTTVPSITFQKQITKQIVKTLLWSKVPKELINTIYGEIDASPISTLTPEHVQMLIDNLIASPESVSRAFGLPPTETQTALEFYQEKASAVVRAQTAAAERAADGTVGDQTSERTDTNGELNGSRQLPQAPE